MSINFYERWKTLAVSVTDKSDDSLAESSADEEDTEKVAITGFLKLTARDV